MESSSDKPKIRLDLNLGKERANRELDLRRWAATAPISLPEFCQEARGLLEQYEDPGALLLLHESYQDRGNNAPPVLGIHRNPREHGRVDKSATHTAAVEMTRFEQAD